MAIGIDDVVVPTYSSSSDDDFAYEFHFEVPTV
jgi:hypothetical protein